METETKTETALAVKRLDAIAEVTGFSKREIALVKQTVAKGASDEELMMFLRIANKFDLDPFAHEIWCYRIQQNEPMVIAAGHDGFMKTALNRPDFLGISSGTVRVGDVFEYEPTAYTIRHKHGEKRGDILGGWAMLERQGKRPAIVYVELKEHIKKTRDGAPNKFWAQYPSRMIEKCARMYAIRMAYTISGLVPDESGGGSVGDDIQHLEELGIGHISLPDPDHAFDRDPDDNGFQQLGEEPIQAEMVEDDNFKANLMALADETKTPPALVQAQALKIDKECGGDPTKLDETGRAAIVSWLEEKRTA